MRKTLIATPLVAIALGALAGGVAFASDSAPAAPPTTLPGMDMLTELGLTPEQTQCLVDNIGNVDLNDITALGELMSQCGISMDELMQMGLPTDSTVPGVVESTVPGVVESSPPADSAVPSADIDAATAAAVLALFSLDEAAVDCLVTEAEAVAPTDDETAESVFVTCGVGPLQILEGIAALDAAAGEADGLEPATTEVLVDDSVEDSIDDSVPAVTTGNPMLDLLLEQLAAEGINLDAEQGQCLLDNISELDPNDPMASLEVFEACGVELDDLLAGG